MNQTYYKTICPKEAQKRLLKDEISIVDVRTDAEYFDSRVKGALHVPVMELMSRMSELCQTKDLVFMCRTGVRSALACEYALAANIEPKRVFNLEGGIVAWEKNGLDTVSGDI